jgi:hypothetical protein
VDSDREDPALLKVKNEVNKIFKQFKMRIDENAPDN